MADLFTLFDGNMGAGGGASLSRQSLDSFSDISSENDLIAMLASGSDSIDLLIDYSDFSNFVTFNSAESYVTITADQILNSYPHDGTSDDIQSFINSLDGYQRYFLSLWPSRTGHLRIDRSVSASFIRIDDFGVHAGVARTSFVSPGTGSMSIQGWIDVPPVTGSNEATFVFQKITDAGDGCSVFISGSSLCFNVTSGSSSATTVGPLTEMPMFFAAVLDRSSPTGSALVYTATTGSYPLLASSESIIIGPRFDLASGSFYFGSGTMASKLTMPFTGSMDSMSVWSKARSLTDMSGTYNRRFHAQPDLVGLWDFNSAFPSTVSSYASIARDSSGHRLDGRIQSYHSGVLGSGSLVFDSPDPVLSLDDSDVISYVVQAQVSGALYDRDNQSIIFNLFPTSFSNAGPTPDVFKNFALILARHFDRIKTYVDQLANLRRVHYGEFDQAPDEILDIVAQSFGWELGGGFVTSDALRYFVGRGVRPGPQGNDRAALADVKSEFWRRVMLNLMYLYKTKGTGESVEALLRIYGIDSGFIRLKEYARKSENRISLEPVVSEKSAYAFRFMSGSSVSIQGISPGLGDNFSFELRTRFPGTDTDSLVASELSGALVTVSSDSSGSYLSLWYEKADVGATTGNIFLTSSNGRVQLTSASLFDERFYNFAVVRETATGSIAIYASRYDDGDLVYATSSISFSGSTGFPISVLRNNVEIGSSSLIHSSGQFWGHEFRLWNDPLAYDEILAHARNYESYGRDASINNSNLLIHWRMNEGNTASSSGTLQVTDSTLNNSTGLGTNIIPSTIPYDKFLFDYAYIPGIDFGNQKKIRVYEGSRIDPMDSYQDERFISLEFNMYDALNEDISHIMTSYDELNVVLGLPMNRYREDYEGLIQMRETYFKRLQGKLNFRVFADMLDFFDSSFSSLVERLIPARTSFRGDELVVESHMLERPKYQYQLRPIIEGRIEVSGSISIVDREDDFD